MKQLDISELSKKHQCCTTHVKHDRAQMNEADGKEFVRKYNQFVSSMMSLEKYGGLKHLVTTTYEHEGKYITQIFGIGNALKF